VKLTTLPSSAEAKYARSHASTPQYAFMPWSSVKAQGQLYLYFYLTFRKSCYAYLTAWTSVLLNCVLKIVWGNFILICIRQI
jgi:hypothetical protein